MAIKDLTGQKFGRLTVIKLSEKRHPKNNKILWECSCECGNEEIIYATTANLKQGYKTSCGCAKKDQFKQVQKNNIKDLTNQKFGKLTACYLIENSSPPMWHCVCDCGNEIDRYARDLYQGKTTSCGCGRRDLRNSLIGKRFGKLVVIERAENYISPSGQSQVQYLCRCDCGNEIIVHASSLTKGLTSSCGCIKSMGELIFSKLLQEKKLLYKEEYKIEECKDKKPLPFDFAIFNDNNELLCLVELNGKQHYEPSFTSNDLEAQSLLEYTQYHDTIKQNYCKEHNIPLLVIPYYELNQMKEIFNNFIGEILK